MTREDEIFKRIRKSAQAFITHVWPVIRSEPIIGGGELIPMEGMAEKWAAELFDKYSGIDAWHVRHDTGTIRGIASRMQSTYKLFRTFTVRRSEYIKRKRELDSQDVIRPSIFVQAYFSPPQNEYKTLRLILVAKMDDIIATVRDGAKGTRVLCETGQADWYADQTRPGRYAEIDVKHFAVVPLSTLQRRGCVTFCKEFDT